VANRCSARYFFAAEHQLAKERGAVRLASVQARLLQCFYLLTQSRINHCWNLFGTLSHLALAIGLHRGRRCESSSTVDYVELESRRRLFWCAYSLDKYLAAALGRPRTFKDEDIDQVSLFVNCVLYVLTCVIGTTNNSQRYRPPSALYQTHDVSKSLLCNDGTGRAHQANPNCVSRPSRPLLHPPTQPNTPHRALLEIYSRPTCMAQFSLPLPQRRRRPRN
jgi:hypothetical protein